jgi:hypothetical protein
MGDSADTWVHGDTALNGEPPPPVVNENALLIPADLGERQSIADKSMFMDNDVWMSKNDIRVCCMLDCVLLGLVKERFIVMGGGRGG